jgi:hypothetical protein
VTGNNHGDAVEVLDEVFLQKLWISPIWVIVKQKENLNAIPWAIY